MTSRDAAAVDVLRASLRPGMTVAVGDGVGMVRGLSDGTPVAAALSTAARDVGGIRLVLGWLPSPLTGLDPDAFTDVVALMPGWGVREVLRHPRARFIPTRLSGISALLTGPLRPDLLLTRLAHRGGLLHFGTEVSWQRGVVDAGIPTLGVVDLSMPAACAKPLNPSAVTVLGYADDGPVTLPAKEPEGIHEALADEVLRWIPPGARIQYGPGQLGSALLRRSSVPLHVDTGLLTDAVLDLESHGLLAGTPTATYLLGGEALYQWADGRDVLRGVDYTHDLTRLSRGTPFFAVNTAIEVDHHGQVNVEGRGEKVVGGIGGHPDYCTAGRVSSGGLSIIAVPRTVNGHSPLVERLSRPVSTPAYDVDVIATEHGSVDLRCADWARRRAMITELFQS